MSAVTAAPFAGTAVGRHLAPLLERVAPPVVIDAHTHLGRDRDGSACDGRELLAGLDPLGARAVAFAFCDPRGLRAANDEVLAAAAGADGRIIPFCRVNPHDDPAHEARRAIAAGARGIKLHPRAEDFTLDHPGVAAAVAVAGEHGLPVLIHAGRGIEPLGAHALSLAQAHPDATLILAHAAICDLAWIGDALRQTPNVVIDTSWWNPADLLAMFATVPPGRIVFASDAPYGDPGLNALLTLRCALAAGLTEEQAAAVMGTTLETILDGGRAPELGPPPATRPAAVDTDLWRVLTYLAGTWGAAMGGGDPAEMLGLARIALAVPGEHPHAALAAEIGSVLDGEPFGPRGLGGPAVAALLAATPGM